MASRGSPFLYLLNTTYEKASTQKREKMKNPKETKPLIIFTAIAICGALTPILIPLINGNETLSPIHFIASISIGILVAFYSYSNRNLIAKFNRNTVKDYPQVLKALIFGARTQAKKDNSDPDRIK